MTITIEIPAERCQTVFWEKVINATDEGLGLLAAKQYNQALQTYQQFLKYASLLAVPEQREAVVAQIFQSEGFNLIELTQLPGEQQQQWIEWLQKVQEYALDLQQYAVNLGSNASLGITQALERLANNYKVLKRNDLAAIALQQATEIALQIPQPGDRTYEFIQIATIWSQFQNKALAEQALTQALVAFEQIQNREPYMHAQYTFPIASLYIQIGLPQQALKLAAKSDELDYIPNSIRQEVVQDAVKRKQIQFAQAIANQITQVEYQVNPLVTIAVYWATHNRINRANRLFTRVLQLVEKEDSTQYLQSSLIQAYAKSGQLTLALNAAQRLTQPEQKTMALGAIIVAYSRAKQSRQVQKVLRLVKDLIQSPGAADPTGYLRNIAAITTDAQQYDLAIRILNSFKNVNKDFLDLSFIGSLYRQIVLAQLRSHRPNKAWQIAQQIPKDVYPDEYYTLLQEIAIAYANEKRWYQALAVAAQINNNVNSPYQVLAQAELAAIAPTEEQFTSLIHAAYQQVETLEIPQRVLGLSAIAQACLRFGAVEKTEAFLEQAIQTAQQIEDADVRGNLIIKSTDYLIEKKQYTAALTLAQANPVSYLQQSSYSRIFSEAVACYGFYVALQVVELNTLPDTQATQLLAIAKTYAQLGRNEDAIALLDRAFEVAQKIADPESRIIQVSEYTQIDDDSDRAHQYTRLVKQYVALGQPDKAQRVVEQAQATTLRDYLQAWISC